MNAQEQQPYLELNLYVGLVGAGVVLLPFFFISFMFKVEKIILIVENNLKGIVHNFSIFGQISYFE